MFEGKLVRLRAYSKDDLVIAKEMLNQSDVIQFLSPGTPYPLKIEDEEKWYNSFDATSESTYGFAIELKENNQYIGGCGFANLDWKNRYGIVGIFLGSEFHNQGYGTDALTVLVRFAFEQMNLNKVQLDVFSFNERGIACYKKIGFREEGRLRQTIFRNGRYYDTVVMGILGEEWADKSGQV